LDELELKAKQSLHKTASIQVADPNSINRRALFDSYIANFPEEKIKRLDICFAAGQHYRELRRWLKNQVKDGSMPDLAFRRILTSRKRPLEFNKKTRPPNWQ
jgi:hypothetical protein